jgi:hypothetical protein
VSIFLTSRPERRILTQFKSEENIFLYLSKTVDKRTNLEQRAMLPAQCPLASHERYQNFYLVVGKAFRYGDSIIEDDNPVERLRALPGFTVSDNPPFHNPLDELYSLVTSTALDPKKRRKEEIA